MSQILIGYKHLDNLPQFTPVAKRIYPSIGVDPGVFASKEEIDCIKQRLKIENRDGKIISIIEDREFVEKKLEDDEEYKIVSKKGVYPMSGPMMGIIHIDYLTLLK